MTDYCADPSHAHARSNGYPAFTALDLADYSGRPAASYSEYATEAIKQATVLFKFATCLSVWPQDADAAELARYAILAMADRLVLTQPHQSAIASPFSSESIGSYSYSKAVRQIQSGDSTGVDWFDLAVERLGRCETGAGVYSGSLSVFEYGEPVVELEDGDRRFLGPRDIERVHGLVRPRDPGLV